MRWRTRSTPTHQGVQNRYNLQMSDCIFCRIASGDVPAKFVYQDEHCVAFPDNSAQAPVHMLVVPKKHIASLAHDNAADEALLGRLMGAVRDVAETSGLAEGYRVVINTGNHGGQTVPHLHIHVLGGRHMGWPPG